MEISRGTVSMCKTSSKWQVVHHLSCLIFSGFSILMTTKKNCWNGSHIFICYQYLTIQYKGLVASYTNEIKYVNSIYYEGLDQTCLMSISIQIYFKILKKGKKTFRQKHHHGPKKSKVYIFFLTSGKKRKNYDSGCLWSLL